MKVSLSGTQNTECHNTSLWCERNTSLLVGGLLFLLQHPTHTNHGSFYVEIEQKKYQPSWVERHYREYKEEDLSKILEGFPLCVHCRQNQGSWELHFGPLHCLLT